ncbi:hypothetical protein THF1C08_40078 [Vibrio jasicida]|uniref:Secreted protein n=1 Tax=Vibrio jasicida TaxID=766224 RepID=A0AAU9QIH0_9VIBR|nr:hypothetical protein THF1A12_190079 [Vibrio jasicida]CAH1596391.1 hypothetical protein THF1C08_40078 [Vibrio jasicida]
MSIDSKHKKYTAYALYIVLYILNSNYTVIIRHSNYNYRTSSNGLSLFRLIRSQAIYFRKPVSGRCWLRTGLDRSFYY